MINAFIITLVSGLSTLIGMIFTYIKISDKNLNKFIVFSLGISISVMIGISITELIPESFFYLMTEYGLKNGQYVVLLISLKAYFLISLISSKIKLKDNGLYKLGILSMLVLVIHNLPEGIATFMTSYKDIDLGIKLGIAITLHNVPEGILIAVPIYYGTKSRKKAFLYTFLAGISEFIGGVITYLFLKPYITYKILNMILLFVGVLMISLANKEIYPKAYSYNEGKYLKIGLLLGIIILLFNYILH